MLERLHVTRRALSRAPVIDHGDAEPRLLEALVQRTPPFDDVEGPVEDRY